MFIIVKKAVKYRITGVILGFFDYLCSTKRLNTAPMQKRLTLNIYKYESRINSRRDRKRRKGRFF